MTVDHLDVAIIGGGVIGLAVAEAVSRRRGEVALLERHPAFGRETSSRNSEVIHAGIYYPPDMRKTRLCVSGRRLLYRRCAAAGIPHRRCGKLIVAVDESEASSLETLRARGEANGVENLRLIGRRELRKREPHVRAVAALHSPRTGIVDSHALMAHLATEAAAREAYVVFGAAAHGLEPTGKGWTVRYRDSAGEGVLHARAVVNAAGLAAQAVMRLAGLDPEALGLSGYFCKGDYFALRSEKRKLIGGLVYPSPEANLEGLGIHTVADLGGGQKLGPNACYVDTVDYAVDPAHAEAFYRSAARYLPFLEPADLAADTSGIRPKLAGPGEPPRDFHIAHEAGNGAPGFFNLAGIESPGLTACLAIADEVAALIDDYLG